MSWSGIPAAITVKEDDWTGICHPNKQQTASTAVLKGERKVVQTNSF